MDSGAQLGSRGLLWKQVESNDQTAVLFFFFFLSPHCTNTTVMHRFTMTITSAPRNHGNIELINSRIEELLVHVVHAAFLFMRMKLAQGLQRFVSDVLGYINLLASYSPLPPIPPSPIPSPVHGCVHVCSCACLLTFSIHSPERGRRGRAKTIPTFFPKASCLPCLLHFFFSRHFFLNKILFFRSPTQPPHTHPYPPPCFLLPLSNCVHWSWSGFFFARCWELFKSSLLPLSCALGCELGNFAEACEKVVGFCIDVVVSVIFVQVSHCRHWPLSTMSLLTRKTHLIKIGKSLQFFFFPPAF